MRHQEHSNLLTPVKSETMAQKFQLNRTKAILGILVLALVAEFAVSGLAGALGNARSDFSEPFVGAWLLRHGQNPYSRGLANSTAQQLMSFPVVLAPIYPVTAYVTVMPFSFLPWKLAAFIWVALSLAAIALILWGLLRIGRLDTRNNKAWWLATMVCAFPPLHRAIHVGNAAVIAVGACLLAIVLAEEARDFAAALPLAIATALKPQLGIWILVFYAVRKRWRIVIVGLAALAALALFGLARMPVPVATMIADYRQNLQYWFQPGGPNDFSWANPLRFQLVNSQVLFWQIVRSNFVANVMANVLFVLGLAVWAYGVFRKQLSSELLALTSLIALSFVSIYHSLSDVSILVIGFCWVLENSVERVTRLKRWALVLLLLLSIPAQSLLFRLGASERPGITGSWWWGFLVEPYFIWVLLLLNVALLLALTTSGNAEAKPGDQISTADATLTRSQLS